MSGICMLKAPKSLKVKDTFSSESSLSKRKFFKPMSMVSLPNLIEVQMNSYNWLLEKGLKELLDEVNPIVDFTEKDLELSFKEYYLDEPKYNEVVAKNKNISYEAPLRCKAQLLIKKTGEVREQELYLGDFPLMTDRGTFIVNGVERVVVNQIIRSPGVFFSMNYQKGKKLFGAKIIPNRGAWLEIETDAEGAIYVKIDRKRKVAITSLLRAFGFGTDAKLLEVFKDTDKGEVSFIEETIKKDITKSQGEGYKEVYKRIRPGDLATESNAKQVIDSMFFSFGKYDFGAVGRYRLNQRLEIEEPNDEVHRVLTHSDLILIIKEIIRLNNDPMAAADDIDHLGNRRVRSVGELVQNKLRVGFARTVRNIKDRMSTCDTETVVPGQLINSRPIAASIKEFFASSQLSQFMDQVNPLAELEHKRRISAMGPGGLTRERAGFEVRDVHHSHYGRICPVETPEGPNIGLVGHLATYTKINQYGFLETPYLQVQKEVENKEEKLLHRILDEKVNGLAIGTLLDEVSAKKVAKDKAKKIKVKPFVSEDIDYINATVEDRKNITHAGINIDEFDNILDEVVGARVKGHTTEIEATKLDYIDVSAKQCISVATSLIPFLEHDDANRALMGSNMQRQAVSCVKPQAPLVGTGIEDKAAVDSGQVVVAKAAGEVTEVDADHIIIKEKAPVGAKKPFSKRDFHNV